MIQLNNIDKKFGKDENTVYAVRDVNIQILPGEIFGIIGFSGAGKSTLVRCMNLLERPDSGQVYFDGTELTSLSEKELWKKRQSIGMIFQHFNLMPSRTVSDNIAYPLKGKEISKEEIKRKVKSLLELVELSDKENAYPSQLSGGQKQRVAIARALANEPKVLLCDEATSALDPQTTRSILRLLKNVNQKFGITIVVITHEMSVVKEICNRVAVMDGGKIVEEGNVFDIFSNPKQEITRGFIDITSTLNKVYELIEEKSSVVDIVPGQKIVRFRYLRKDVSEPLVSMISRKYEIDCNIIFGNIEIIQEAPLGGLVAILSGSEKRIDAALEDLKERHVGVEVIRE